MERRVFQGHQLVTENYNLKVLVPFFSGSILKNDRQENAISPTCIPIYHEFTICHASGFSVNYVWSWQNSCNYITGNIKMTLKIWSIRKPKILTYTRCPFTSPLHKSFDYTKSHFDTPIILEDTICTFVYIRWHPLNTINYK